MPKLEPGWNERLCWRGYILLMILIKIISDYYNTELLDGWDNHRSDGRIWTIMVTEIPPWLPRYRMDGTWNPLCLGPCLMAPHVLFLFPGDNGGVGGKEGGDWRDRYGSISSSYNIRSSYYLANTYYFICLPSFLFEFVIANRIYIITTPMSFFSFFFFCRFARVCLIWISLGLSG